MIGTKIGNRLLLKHSVKSADKKSQPWQHWIVDDFFDPVTLQEVKSFPSKSQQTVPGRRVGSHRFFVDDQNQDRFPRLGLVWKALKKYQPINEYFSLQTGIDYSNLFPRLEIISDWGDFYLEPHHDHLEKKLSAMIYTDHKQLWPGTELTDGYRIESRDNRCFFFVPGVHTVHGYPLTHLHQVRRCVLINYWTLPA